MVGQGDEMVYQDNWMVLEQICIADKMASSFKKILENYYIWEIVVYSVSVE